MAKFAAIVLCVTFGSLLYVYTEVEAVRIGYEIRKQEETKTAFLDRARALKYNIARLKAPHNLERKLLSQRIVLESPKSWKTLVVQDGSKPAQTVMQRPAFFGKFFVGTAQAEAKESSR